MRASISNLPIRIGEISIKFFFSNLHFGRRIALDVAVLDGGSGGLGLGEVGLEEHQCLRVQRLQAQVFVFEDGR